MESSSDNVFKLSEMDTAFTSRTRDVFSCLDSIEAKHSAFEKNRSDDRSDFLKPDPAEEPVTCKTTFKSPKGIPWKRKLPNYKVRPDRWKMYDLSDVSLDHLSEQSNTRTALEFIKNGNSRCNSDVANRKDEEDMDFDTDKEVGRLSFASNKKHVFRKPTTLNQTLSEENQSDYKGASQTIDGSPNILVAQPSEDREVEESVQEVETSPGNEQQVDSTQLHFQSKGLHSKKKNIRPKALHNDSDDEDDVDLQDSSSVRTSSVQKSDEKSESDESNEFSEEDAEVNSDSDEEHSTISDLESTGWEYSVITAKGLQEMKSNEQESSDDEDIGIRAAGYTYVESIQNSCLVLADDKDFEGKSCDKASDNLMDDLDCID